MKYLMLLNNTVEAWDSWRELSPAGRQRAREEQMPRWNAMFDWAGTQDIDVTGLELEDPAQARVVQVRDGETLVTDGPYVETKELLGGYFLADCRDLDQAIELAERVPVASRGSVEIRPLATQ